MWKQISIILLGAFLNVYFVKYCSANVKARIMGVEEVFFNDYPYMVALFKKKDNYFICGGTIIRKDWILTAAHCVINMEPEELYARVGALRTDDGGQVIDVLLVIANRWYNENTGEDDIALLNVGNNIVLRHTAAPIQMTDVGYKLPQPGSFVRILGFGRASTRPKDQYLKLREIELAVMDFEACKNIYRNSIYKVTNTMFCLDGTIQQQSGCTGDSGGPAVYNEKLIGIISWAKNCDIAAHPLVLHRVDSFRPWINNMMEIYS